jgi:hypothetical protein
MNRVNTEYSSFSLEPVEFDQIVDSIRTNEQALGAVSFSAGIFGKRASRDLERAPH